MQSNGENSVEPEAALVEKFRRAGQGQVFAFLDALKPAERRALFEEAAEIDLEAVSALTRGYLAQKTAPELTSSDLAPMVFQSRPEQGGDPEAWARARTLGETVLRQGGVAAFTVAGGQGTRLNCEAPKGTFPVTPVRQKPLFQVFAEKIRAAGTRYRRPLHWFIMTSHATHAATEIFFQEHAFFGLDAARVHFVRQGRMPAVDLQGRLLLATKGSLALSPNGHGGTFRALADHGALDLMERAQIHTLSYFQVDNPLVHCIDPAFIGWHRSLGAEMTTKIVRKTRGDEKVGVVCIRRGKPTVVEYSELPAALQGETEPNGPLRYLAGNIAVHLLDREFVRRVAAGGAGLELPFHHAVKKILTVDAQGQLVEPAEPNGVKFEKFVFDALPFAQNPGVIEASRAEEFSPVKNPAGPDSPQTCREDQLRQFARWFKRCGVELETDATGLPRTALEVSPLFGYDEETFAEAWAKLSPRPKIQDGLYLE